MKLATFTVVLCLLAGSFGAALAQDDAGAGAYQGLDILFLVDQSASMSGATGRIPTDPLNLRFTAVQYALDTLSEYRASVPIDTTFRMSVMHFGTGAEVGMDWTVIGRSGDPAWEAQRDALRAALSADAFGDRTLVETDFLTAFEAVRDQFNRLPPPPGGAQHLRVLIILTDGAPCVFTDADPSCTDVSRQRAHMSELVTLAREAFPADRYRLFVIALDDAGVYWFDFEGYWQQVVVEPDNATRVTSPNEIGQRFWTILNALLVQVADVTGNEDRGPFAFVDGQAEVAVPPYYQTMRLTFFKNQPTPTGVTLTDPQGRTLRAGDPFVSAGGQDTTIEVWVVNRPQPGVWQVTAPDAANLLDSYRDLIPITIQGRVTASADPITLFTPVTLEVVLTDANGSPLPVYADPQYALRLTASLAAPDGASQALDLPLPSDAGVAPVVVTPAEQGVHTVTLNGVTRGVDGSPRAVFSDLAAGSFEVAPWVVEVMGFPAAPLLVSESVSLAVTVARGDGDAGLPPEMQSLDVLATVYTQTGGVWSQFALSRAGAGDGSYTGAVEMTEAGDFSITVQVRAADGQPLHEAQSPMFTVEPATFAALVWETPADRETSYVTAGFPPLEPTTVDVRLHVIDQAAGTPMDVARLTPSSVQIELVVTDVAAAETVRTLALAPGDKPGHYAAALDGLGEGEYTLAVRASGDLVYGTLWDPASREQTRTIIRQTNPALYLFYAGVGAAALAVVASAGGVLLVRHRRRQHPVRGMLSITYDDAMTPGVERDIVWQVPLDSFHSNRIVLKGRRLPRRLGIKQITVTCPNAGMSSRRQVRVSVQMKDKRAPAIADRQFNPGAEALLYNDAEGAYYLVKDAETFY